MEWSLSSDLSGKTTTAQGDVRPFTMDSGRTWYTHMANMTGLSPSTRYYYKVHSASGNESSAIFSFKTQPTAATLDSNLPELHLIYGDMGSRDAFTLCSTCTGHSLVCDKTTCASANQSAGLISEIANSNHIVHVGTYIFSFPFFKKYNLLFFFIFFYFLSSSLPPFFLFTSTPVPTSR